MFDTDHATRRTILKAAGVTVGTAVLGSAAYAASQTATQNDSRASVEWYNTYTGDESLYFFHSLMGTDNGYTAVGGGLIKEITSDGETIQSNEHGYPVVNDTVQTADGNYVHVGDDNYEEAAGGNYAIAAKTDAAGNELWSWDYETGEGTNTRLLAAAAAPDGGAYGFGANETEGNPFGVRFDAAGTVEWLQTWSAGTDDENDERFEEGFENAIPATDGGALVWDPYSAGRVTPDGQLDWTGSYDSSDGEYYLMNAIPQRDGSGYVMTGKIHYTRSGGDVNRTNQLALLFLDEDGGSRSVHFDAPNPDGAENVSLVDLARTDRGLVIGSTYKRQIDDTDGDGEDDYDFDAWLLGLTRAGEHRWYLSPGDTSNTDQTYVMAGSGRSVVLGGRWHEGHDTSGDDPLDSFVTRVSEPDEETPTETTTPTRTDTETESGTDDETQTDTEPGTETQTDEKDCEI